MPTQATDGSIRLGGVEMIPLLTYKIDWQEANLSANLGVTPTRLFLTVQREGKEFSIAFFNAGQVFEIRMESAREKLSGPVSSALLHGMRKIITGVLKDPAPSKNALSGLAEHLNMLAAELEARFPDELEAMEKELTMLREISSILPSCNLTRAAENEELENFVSESIRETEGNLTSAILRQEPRLHPPARELLK